MSIWPFLLFLAALNWSTICYEATYVLDICKGIIGEHLTSYQLNGGLYPYVTGNKYILSVILNISNKII